MLLDRLPRILGKIMQPFECFRVSLQHFPVQFGIRLVKIVVLGRGSTRSVITVYFLAVTAMSLNIPAASPAIMAQPHVPTSV